MTLTNGESISVNSLQERVSALEEEVMQMREQLERMEIQSAIKQGLEEADQGLGTPAVELVEKLRTKYGLPRP